MTEKRKILAAIGDKGLVKKLKEVFNGNVKLVDESGTAVQVFNSEPYSVVVLDYLVTGNAVQAAIQIGAFSNDVDIVGYRWEKDFEGMTKHNEVSERDLFCAVCKYLGVADKKAQTIAGKFDDADQTAKYKKKVNKSTT